jgi:hypothetical protein
VKVAARHFHANSPVAAYVFLPSDLVHWQQPVETKPAIEIGQSHWHIKMYQFDSNFLLASTSCRHQ